MRRYDIIALILSVVAIFISAWIAINIYEAIPHIEDEITYVWQAELAADGKLTIGSPVCPRCFLVPFVIDLDGLRFGKYPPGWPVLLSFAIRFGFRTILNPLLAGLYVWLNYLLVKKLTNPIVGLIATILTISSPFFLMNSGTLLAHPFALLLVVIFSLSWLDSFDSQRKAPLCLTGTTAVLSLGLLILTRPLTAVGICIPFFIFGLAKLFKGTKTEKITVITIGIGVILMGGIYLLWQYRLTGDFFTNPYTLYWPYDRIGFGSGVGLHTDGHQLKYAWINTKFSLRVGNGDLFGWPYLSWILLPFGLFALRKSPRALMIGTVVITLVLVYGLYWIGSWVFGPRYYYEALSSLSLLSAAGFYWLAGFTKPAKAQKTKRKIRFILTSTIFSLFLAGNILFYLPLRLGGMKGLYGIEKSMLEPFLTEAAQELTPALIIVDPRQYWLEYGALLDLSRPQLDSPFIFTYDRGEELNRKVIDTFPERTTIYYDPGQPYTFFIETQ